MKTRNLMLFLALALIVGGAAIFTHLRANAAEPTKKAMNLSFKGLDGKTLKLSDYRGKVVVIDVWATWCGYCVQEIPDLVAYQKDITEKKLDVQIIGVSVDRDTKVVRDFVKEHKLNYPIVMGDAKSLKPFGNIPGIPVKFILDKDGVLVDKHIGAIDREGLEKMVEKHLKDKK